MKIGLLIFTLLLAIPAKCQIEKSEFHLTHDSDISFWKKYINEDIEKFQLPELNLKSEFVFRSWNPGNLLEISKHQDSIIGKIVYFVLKVSDENSKDVTFVKTYELPKSTSNALYEYILNSGFQKIPSDKFIQDWHQGFDGITHIFEYKGVDSYSFKKYWTPKTQSGIKEAEFIINFNDTISRIGEFEKYRNDFIQENPFKVYKYSGTAYSIRTLGTKKKWLKFKQFWSKNKENKR